MSRLRSFVAFACIAIAGCSNSRPASPRNLPAPVDRTSLGPGDILNVEVLSEALPKEYRVRPDGTIDFPYIGKVPVEGLEPEAVGDLLKKRLAEAKILSDPQVLVNVSQYNSKHISVIGQVMKPGSVKFSPGMKLVDALTECGWFTNIADSNHVLLTREVSPTKLVTAVISVDAITDGQQQDLALQAGDTIKVEPRVF